MERVIRATTPLPLVQVDDETRKRLRALACQASRYGNQVLAGQYSAMRADLKGDVRKQLNATLWAVQNDELSGWVRNAMQNKAKAYWTRSAKDVLSGRERLACFSADKALTIQADTTNNQGVLYERDTDGRFVLACRFEPVKMYDEDGNYAGKREPIRLVVDLDSPGARRDWCIRGACEAIWSGTWAPSVVTIIFDKRCRKLTARITHSRPAPDMVSGVGASLGPYRPDTGELWLRFDSDARPINYADRINHMRHMKEHHEGIVHRLRRRMGSGTKGRRRAYRKKLAEIGDFGAWAKDRMHELSRMIVKACQEQEAGELRIVALGEGDLPWAQLEWQLRYKCRDVGIAFTAPNVRQDATAKAERAEIGKQARRLKKARKGIVATKELLRAVV